MIFLLLAIVAGGFFYWETQTSHFQAEYLSGLAKELNYEVKSGPNSEFYTPKNGPYDYRLGYSRLPGFISRLTAQGFEVEEQARISPRLQQVIEKGLFMPYREKNQGGIRLHDAEGDTLYKMQFPTRIYNKFENVPDVVVDSLLFIENRNLLDIENPKMNPAIDWVRIGRAFFDKTIQQFWKEHDVPGGSTLATQIEKFRHSPEGLTQNMRDKFQQIISASVRAYLNGEQTIEARKNIVVSYLNTVPLSAVTGFGEVNGLGDGLWAWYGLDFDQMNQAMSTMSKSNQNMAEIAYAYKHILSLMIAQRRPTGYLADDHNMLNRLTNSYLRLLATSGVISSELKDAATDVPLNFRDDLYQEDANSFTSRKAANAVRKRLVSLMGVDRYYDLDRVDMDVKTTLNKHIQESVTNVLRQLKDPDYARAAGLYGDHLLGAADPGKVIYSFTLLEITPEGIKPRVQADNFDQPFDINQGTKLDLGSTAKLRTLVTYLEIIEKLHQQYYSLSPQALRDINVDPSDVLSLWVINYLLENPDGSLKAILDASLDRTYSANPKEAFYTGGGVQYFKNFKNTDNDKVMTLREATRNSVNLVFIRLMRDIRRYYMFQVPGSSANILKNIDDPRREVFLNRFADKEGQEFITRFYANYKGKSSAEISERLFSEVRLIPERLSAAFRYIYPDKDIQALSEFLASRMPEAATLGAKKLDKLFATYMPDRLSLSDQSNIARIHPLELWLARYLLTHPGATLKDAINASGEERKAVYSWLQKTSAKNAQDNRISNLLEVEAFLEIHRSWKRLGYPFDSLIPSLATAIGSSADRPAALAELMGIILNNGVRLPTTMIEEIHFAAGTPYETVLKRVPVKSERLFTPELATALRGVLMDVVEKGTASVMARAITKDDGTQLPVGGKTGTGDHRYITFASAGVIKSSRVVNRSATFVFFIGDRFFGTMTAFVPGSDAAQYKFTSGISVRVLKHLLPVLKPLTDTAQILPEMMVKHIDDDAIEIFDSEESILPSVNDSNIDKQEGNSSGHLEMDDVSEKPALETQEVIENIVD